MKALLKSNRLTPLRISEGLRYSASLGFLCLDCWDGHNRLAPVCPLPLTLEQP